MAILLLQPKPTDEELSLIVEEIKLAESFLVQNLLRESELTALEQRASNVYELAADHNSIQYRKYDRSRRQTTRWREINRSGYVNANDGARLLELKQQIIELLNLHQVDIQPTEVFLPPNSEFEGRIAIRNIISTAAISIDIKDDYLFSANKKTKNIELLAILGPYLSTSLNLEVRLLGSSETPSLAVISDVSAFLKQYPSVKIMGYSHSPQGKRETHDRFIIIDKHDVYKIGTSIKDIGATQSSIDKVNDSAVSRAFDNQFNEWWLKATSYVGLS